ncbi:MAG TPA: ABC transporter substrate-binding protein [Cellulomonas sp.]
MSTHRPVRRWRSAALLVVAAALALSACGSADDGASSGTSGTQSGSTDTLRIGLNRTIGSLDPGEGTEGNATGSLKVALYSSLLSIDGDGELVGDLATSWEQTAPTEWTFTIRTDATFSDGSELTAVEIKENFDRLLDPESTLYDAGELQPIIASAAAPDAETLVITTQDTYLRLPERLSTVYFVSPDYVADHNPATEVLGSGPYVLESVDPENGAVLVANPDYYGDAPAYERVEYSVYASEATRVTAVQSGAVDFLSGIDPVDLDQFASSDVYTTNVVSSAWTINLRFNELKEGVSDVRVRQALNYAVDKEALIDAFLGGAVEPQAGQVLATGFETTNPDLSAYPYDPDKARELLAEAGYSDGLTLQLDYPEGSYLAVDSIVQAIAAQLEEVGVTLQLNPLTFANYITKTESDDEGTLVYQGWGGNYPVAAERLRLFASSHPNVRLGDEVYDAAVDAAASATTDEEEQTAVDEATQRFYDEAHALFLFPQPISYVISQDIDWTPRVEGWIRPQDFTPAT